MRGEDLYEYNISTMINNLIFTIILIKPFSWYLIKISC